MSDVITAEDVCAGRLYVREQAFRHSEVQAMVHLIERVYVRGEHGRVIELELVPGSKVWWATERALSVLGDSRDVDECRLLLRGKELASWRSLEATGVRDGDTLELVSASAVPHRSRGLRRLRKPRSPS